MELTGILALMIPMVALLIPIVAIWTAHQRRMLELRLQLQLGAQNTANTETGNLKHEFYTLRESLTAHAMSVDENMKALASRMNSVENRLGPLEANTQNAGGVAPHP